MGIITEFRSMGLCAAEQWHSLMRNTHRVNMDFHPALSSTSVFLLNLDRSLAQGVAVSVTLNMTREHWHSCLELEQQIKDRDPSVSVYRHVVFEDPVFNTEPLDYTDEQLALLREQYLDLYLGNELTDYATLVLENKNRFRGWQCRAGLEQCVVDAWGRVYRSHCRYLGYMGKISEPKIQWPTDEIICGLDQCVNAFDIRAIKIKPDAA
jgi:hypothetical protein